MNEKTVDDKYTIAQIIELLDKLGYAQYFTTLDFDSGFHKIDIDKEIPKIAFSERPL